MISNNAVLGAAIFIIMILVANAVMYGIARAWTHPGQKSLWEILGKSITTSTRPKDDPMDELHRKMEELQKGKKEDMGDSE